MAASDKLDVLFVDDDALVRRALARAMRDVRPDWSSSFASTAEEALQMLSERSFHVVVSDLAMPGMSGLDVLKHLRIASPETDVIIMTAFGTVESAVEAMRHGAHDYVSKPFSSDELIVLLNRLAN